MSEQGRSVWSVRFNQHSLIGTETYRELRAMAKEHYPRQWLIALDCLIAGYVKGANKEGQGQEEVDEEADDE